MNDNDDTSRQTAAENILRLSAEIVKIFDEYPDRTDSQDMLDKIGDELYPALDNVDYFLKSGDEGRYSAGLKFFEQ